MIVLLKYKCTSWCKLWQPQLITSTSPRSFGTELQSLCDRRRRMSTAGVKCQDATFGTDEACVVDTVTHHMDALLAVCVCVCARRQWCKQSQYQIVKHMTAPKTNHCVQRGEMQFGDASIGKLLNRTWWLRDREGLMTSLLLSYSWTHNKRCNSNWLPTADSGFTQRQNHKYMNVQHCRAEKNTVLTKRCTLWTKIINNVKCNVK